MQRIRSISNAYKHLYTGLKEDYAKHSSISSAVTIESIIFENEKVQDLSEEYMGENNGELKVVYTRKNGEQLLFLKAIRQRENPHARTKTKPRKNT
jgi:hypothetical protein